MLVACGWGPSVCADLGGGQGQHKRKYTYLIINKIHTCGSISISIRGNRPLSRLWECSQSGGQNKGNFRFCKTIDLYSRLGAFPQMCKGLFAKAWAITTNVLVQGVFFLQCYKSAQYKNTSKHGVVLEGTHKRS